DRPVNRVTGADGLFQFMLPVGEWTVTFDVFGYGDEALIVEIIEDETVDGSVAMTALPTAVLSGLIYDYEGALVSGAVVRVLDTPLEPVYSNGSGFYSIDIPAGATYDVLARATGYGAHQQTIDFQGDMTLDFVLPPPTGVGDELPRAVVFFGAVPNPFNPMTSLHFSLPNDSHVDLKIYDVAGHLVRSLVSGSRSAGGNKVRWNGMDNADRAVASGTYFARLVVDDQVEIRSLTLVR
ncbi:carboxypeptidase regulatory-like domain-containing protein, partial [bacterium]|nr:carboxypeptidase regulatory-like domain-containing protein [bacterium]